MSTKLIFLIGLLDKVFARLPKNEKGGKPLKYSHSVFIVFFMVVLYKRIFRFKTMEKYAKLNYAIFGFPNPPSRKTIRRRFLELPKILAFAIPHLAIESLKYSYDTFHFRFAFVDKSVFRSLGGIWHKRHMILNSLIQVLIQRLRGQNQLIIIGVLVTAYTLYVINLDFL